MELKVHIEDHRDLVIGGALIIMGIACVVAIKRDTDRRLKKMQSDLVDEIRRWH